MSVQNARFASVVPAGWAELDEAGAAPSAVQEWAGPGQRYRPLVRRPPQPKQPAPSTKTVDGVAGVAQPKRPQGADRQPVAGPFTQPKPLQRHTRRCFGRCRYPRPSSKPGNLLTQHTAAALATFSSPGRRESRDSRLRTCGASLRGNPSSRGLIFCLTPRVSNPHCQRAMRQPSA